MLKMCSLIRYFIKGLSLIVCYTINLLIPKSNKYIYFIPHPNCRKDKYDLLNSSSDNVLSFLYYLLKRKEFSEYRFYVQVYDPSKIAQYKDFCNVIAPKIEVVFLLSEYFIYEDYSRWKATKISIVNFFLFCKCATVFTSAYWYNFSYKSFRQKIICLNYYVPFKLDDETRIMKLMFNTSFDYCLTTSLIAAQVDSISSGIKCSKYLPLGFSRNDNLLRNIKSNELISSLSEIAGYPVSNVIVYTPTYRDNDDQNKGKRNILGYNCDNTRLYNILTKEHAILIVKLHPLQNMDVYYSLDYSNIYLLQPNETYGLYDYLAIASLLITDYTSTYFDYLILNKPVIFNFFDKESYKRLRGFSFDPIESVCAGKIVYQYEEMLNSIQCYLSGNDEDKKFREVISAVFHKYKDDKSSERICRYFFNV